MDDLSKDFYKSPEMIGYHQAGFVAEYLITHFGIEKFRQLWNKGMSEFESIYGMQYEMMHQEMTDYLNIEYPETPSVDWDSLKEGCDG